MNLSYKNQNAVKLQKMIACLVISNHCETSGKIILVFIGFGPHV